MDRRPRCLRLRQHRPADPGRPPPRLCRPDPQRPPARRHGRGLPRPQSLDADAERHREEAGHRPLPRRRLLRRLQQLARRRWRNARALRRLRRHHREPPPQRARLSLARRPGRVRQQRRGRHGRSRRLPALGEDQCRRLRRRSQPRADHRPVRRRRESQPPARHALRQGPLPARRRDERLAPHRHDARRRREAIRPAARQTRPHAQGYPQAAGYRPTPPCSPPRPTWKPPSAHAAKPRAPSPP